MSQLPKDLQRQLQGLDLEFLHGVPVHLTNEMVSQIAEAFEAAGYMSPENVQKVQAMVNQMADTAQQMAKLPITVREPSTMYSQEWYNRFDKELKTYAWSFDERNSILVAARRAAGLTE